LRSRNAGSRLTVKKNFGVLYLIPVPLGDIAPAQVLPSGVIERVLALDCLVAENAKSARAFLKVAGVVRPLAEIAIGEINTDTAPGAIEAMLKPLLCGRDVGLLSEAGCPGVADPGAALVLAAHRHGIRVSPLVGPSSLLLAVMAAGLNGQNFAFCGYLPVKEAARAKRIRELEEQSRQLRQTQIFIETPFRNQALFATLLQACRAATLLTIARELTLEGEWIATKPVSAWREQPAPDLARKPTVFLLLA
jgi:16S rRNA (cytidine1402-2'-O)-methyltransferase